MTLRVSLHQRVQYRRVAIYLGRIAMADDPHARWASWAKDYTGNIKDSAVRHVTGLTESEWENIKGVMTELADASNGRERWKQIRLDWIMELDTLWAVHNP